MPSKVQIPRVWEESQEMNLKHLPVLQVRKIYPGLLGEAKVPDAAVLSILYYDLYTIYI